MTQAQITALRAIADAIVEAVGASRMGAPAGHLYASLMSTGMSLDQFEQIMSGLVRVGRLTKSGHLYRVAS